MSMKWGSGPLALGMCLLLAAGALAQGARKVEDPNTTGWKDLFKADLSNAEMPAGSWVMEKGVLNARVQDATLWTRESYGNFVLDLEFKVASKANSGVFLRAGDIRDVLSALEIQVHENTDGTKYGMVGALYDAKPPSKNAAKPAGEWNRYIITCRDSRLSLVFNGEKVLDIDLNDWSQARMNPDGTPNKFAKPLKDYPRQGPIGFQGIHGQAGQPVWYRNLRIRELRRAAHDDSRVGVGPERRPAEPRVTH